MLWLLCCWAAAAAAGAGSRAKELPREHLVHHYSWYPCQPREPAEQPVPEEGLLLPPRPPRYWPRGAAAVAERSVLVHLLLLPRPWPGGRPRPLWLFDRSWGVQATPRGLKFHWKDRCACFPVSSCS